jgi:hypothetical protein
LISRNLALLLVGVLGLAIGVSQASADILIDHFSGTNAPVASGTTPTSFSTAPNSWVLSYAPAVTTSVNGTVSEGPSIPGVIGGWGRTTNVVAPNGGNGVNGAFPVMVAVNSSLLAVNTGAPTNMTLTYNGGTPTSTGQNFTGLTGFTIDFNSIDHIGAPITMTIEDTSGKTETESSATTTFTGPGNLIIPLSAFSTAAGFNYGAVSQVTLSIDGSIQDLNYRIDFISANTPTVPEPSSLAIWTLMAGIGGLGLVRASRKS